MPGDGVALGVPKEDTSTPQAAAERQDSKTAFAEVASSEAKGLLLNEFSTELSNLQENPARALDTTDFEEFFNKFAARVDPPGPADSKVLVSSFPLRAEDDSGNLGPVDLDLRSEGDHYEAVNPLADFKFPRSLAQPIVLTEPDIEVSLRTPQAKNATATRLGAGELFYHEVAPDIDAMVSATASGAEVFTQIRSKDAPERFSFGLDLPAGARIAQLGNQAFEIRDGEDPLAIVTAPWAVDSQGTSVELELEASADGFDLVVNHADADVAYPILVDPSIDWLYGTKSWSAWGGNTNAINNWTREGNMGSYGTNFYQPTYCGGVGCQGNGYGLYVYAMGGYQYTAGHWADWYYQAPGATTYISQGHFHPVEYVRGGDNCCNTPHAYEGLFSPARGAWGTLAHRTRSTGNETVVGGWDVFPTNGTFLPASEKTNRAVFGMASSVTRTPAATRTALLGGAYLYLDDAESPSASGPPEGQIVPTGGPVQVPITATDNGLGVQTVKVFTPLASGGESIQTRNVTCSAVSGTTLCPQTATESFTYDPTVLPPGSEAVRIETTDAVGKMGISYWQPDRPPLMGVQGELWDRNDQAPIYEDETPQLLITATDALSGVKSIEVVLDNVSRSYWTQTCPSGGCSMSKTYTLFPSTLPDGYHQVWVYVTDQAGHISTSPLWQFVTETIDDAAADARSAADVPPPDPGTFTPNQAGTNPPSDEYLACTGPEEQSNFRLATGETEAAGYDLEDVTRACAIPVEGPDQAVAVDEPNETINPDPALEGIEIRANYTSYVYGECELPQLSQAEIEGGEEASCSPPIEVQVWPICERTLETYEQDKNEPYPRQEIAPINGVPTFSFDDGLRVELYTADSTVAVFGNASAEVLEAANDLEVAPVDATPVEAPLEPGSGAFPQPVSGGLVGAAPCTP